MEVSQEQRRGKHFTAFQTKGMLCEISGEKGELAVQELLLLQCDSSLAQRGWGRPSDRGNKQELEDCDFASASGLQTIV